MNTSGIIFGGIVAPALLAIGAGLDNLIIGFAGVTLFVGIAAYECGRGSWRR